MLYPQTSHNPRPMETADVCIICHVAHDDSVRLCRQCRAVICSDCAILAVNHAAQTIDSLTASISCPGCRTWMLPSFAQVVRTPELFTALMQCKFDAFWSHVGVPEHPTTGVTVHLFAAYMYAATIQNRMREQSRAFAARRRTLRRTPSRLKTLMCHAQMVAAWETDLLSTNPWPASPSRRGRLAEEP